MIYLISDRPDGARTSQKLYPSLVEICQLTYKKIISNIKTILNKEVAYGQDCH